MTIASIAPALAVAIPSTSFSVHHHSNAAVVDINPLLIVTVSSIAYSYISIMSFLGGLAPHFYTLHSIIASLYRLPTPMPSASNPLPPASHPGTPSPETEPSASYSLLLPFRTLSPITITTPQARKTLRFRLLSIPSDRLRPSHPRLPYEPPLLILTARHKQRQTTNTFPSPK